MEKSPTTWTTKTDSLPVGIDLGTTYSCVAVLQHEKVEIIANDQGNRTTPSCVAFTDVERMVGEAARSQATRNPENTVFEAKRLIGRTFTDVSVHNDRKNWPFKVVNDQERPTVQVEFMGETRRYTAQEISAMVLTKMKETAEAYLGTPVKDAVITVPAYFNDAQRQATKDAGRIAGLKVISIINEPTAAALAYGLDKKLTGQRNVLIFDLGGGTFDVSILSITDASVFKVLATAGDTHLGGEDFDNKLVSHFVKEFKRKYKKDATSSPRAMRKLKMACEQAKRALSTCTEATVEIDSFFQGIYFYSRISRARFEELCNNLFRRTLEPLEQTLKDARLDKSEIHEVVLVGGSTRIPKIQKLLQDFFDGRKLSMGINPDEAVAYGAAIQAAAVSEPPTHTTKPLDVLLMDVVPLSLGTDFGDHHAMCTIIERNTRIPVRKTHEFTPARDFQQTVHVGVYEGERPLVKDNHMLGEFEFSGLRRAPRDQVKVIVEFNVDADGLLSVSAKEDATGKTMKVAITHDRGRLSKKEIERMLHEGFTCQKEDFKRRGAILAIQSLEDLVYLLRRNLEDKGDVLTEDERQRLRRRTDEIITWMDANQMADLDEANGMLCEFQEEMRPFLAKFDPPPPPPEYSEPELKDPAGLDKKSSKKDKKGKKSSGKDEKSTSQKGEKSPRKARRSSSPEERLPDDDGKRGDKESAEPKKSMGMGLDEDEGEDVLRSERAAQDLLRGLRGLGGERGPRVSSRGLWGGLPGDRDSETNRRPPPPTTFTPVMDEVD